MARVAYRGAVVLLTVLLGVASTPSASATSEWTRPSRLGPSGEYVDVAVNRSGDMAALWTTDAVTKARDRPAGAAWRKPAKVGDGGFAPTVALDDRGWTTAVWRENGAAVKRPGKPWRADPDSPFTDAETFSAPPVLVTSGDGLAYLGWTESTSAGASGHSTDAGYFRSPRGGWDSDYGLAGSDTAVAFTPDRYLNVAHQAPGGGVAVTRKLPGRGQASTVQLSDEGVIDDFQLMANRRGALALVGVQRGAAEDAGQLVAFTKPDGRPWRPMLSQHVVGVHSPAITLDDRGNVAISYVEQRGSLTQVKGRVLRVKGRADGGARALSPRRHGVASPSVALDDAGRAVFVWVGGRTDESFTPHAVVRSPRGRWAERRRLARPDGTPASQPQVVARDRGEFTAVYVDERPMYVDLGR